MTDSVRDRAIALYDRFTHEGLDRRAFMAELSRIAGGAAAAQALLIAIAADPAAAAITMPDDPRLRTREHRWRGGAGRALKGYMAEPATNAGKFGAVLVIHENRGLNDHIRDVARRFALAGYRALAPDFLSPVGGTPANEDAAREAIGKLDLDAAVADGVATVAQLRTMPRTNNRAAVVGFCWGGAMTNRIAVAGGKDVAAAIPYYGPAPDPALASRVACPMLIHLAERDARVNATAIPWAEALKAAGKQVQLIVHPGVDHAFNNDTSAARYDKAAADQAWAETLKLLGSTIGVAT